MFLWEILLLACSASIAAAARCGPAGGGLSCPTGFCCSESGYCGTTQPYCTSPQCQLAYSDSCDNYIRPAGSDTLSIPRPLIGNVPYGSIIYNCTIVNTFALTYDDGPYLYTSQLLDILDSYGVKVTFFVTGNNLGKGQMDNESLPWPAIMRRMYNSGHQIASHTWSHQDLSKMTANIQQNEIMYNEMAFRNLFGWIPTYFRFPYLAYDTRAMSLLKTMGYHVMDLNVDTKDYLYNDPTLIQASKDRFSRLVSMDSSSHAYIELGHDIDEQTVVNLTAYMIDTLRARGYRPVPVGECLGDPPANWYRDARGTASTSSSISSTQSSLRSSTPTIVATSSTTPILSSSTTSSSVTTSITTRVLSSSSTSSSVATSSTTRIVSSSSTSSSAAPTSTLLISTNQLCGGTTGRTCQGSTYGNCCSFYGYCGSTSAYCGTGCQTGFGNNCIPITTITTTTNGICGKAYLSTCLGYGTKNCCSASGYCGNTSAYCGTGCQLAYGTCT